MPDTLADAQRLVLKFSWRRKLIILSQISTIWCQRGFPGSKNAGDADSNTGLGRSSGVGNGNPLQYSCLENSMDRRAWRAAVHGARDSQTQLRTRHTWCQSGKCSVKVNNECLFWSGSCRKSLWRGHNWADNWIKQEVNQVTVYK